MKLHTLRSMIFSCSLALASIPVFAAAPARQLLEEGRVDEALSALEQQIAHSPKDALAYNIRCRVYFMIEEWERGLSDCERAVSLDPQNSSYYLWLGRLYGEKAQRSSFVSGPGLAKKTRVSFERSVELDPKNVEARLDLGEFYADAPGIVGGGKDKSRLQADAIMPLSPAMAHWLLARIAEKEKDRARAEAEYRAEISASNSAVRGWTDLANFLLHANRYDEMVQALAHVESAPIDHPGHLMHAGNLALRAQRDYPLAARLLRRYLSGQLCEEGPAFKAHTFLGEVLEKQGDRQGALKEFHAALALFQNYTRAKEDLKKLEN